MEELLTEERKRGLKEKFDMVIAEDILTNQDAMMILQILIDACEREKVKTYEDMIRQSLKGSDAE